MSEPSVGPRPAPIIVSARLAPADFSWLDALRQAHFPPERNQLPAHLTLFHHLPPSIAPELVTRLKQAGAERPPPAATIGEVLNLGRGVALRVRSPELDAIRRDLATAFAGLLTPQDAGGFRAHVTIQNKVTPHEARALYQRLTSEISERPLSILGLDAHWYRGGPWERFAAIRFWGTK